MPHTEWIRRGHVPGLVAALLNACATTVSVSGASTVTERQPTSLALTTGTQTYLPGRPLTFGVESALKWRLDPFDHGNQWHLAPFIGWGRTPQAWSDPFGAEFIGLIGVARAYDGAAAFMQPMLGARGQLLIRMAKTQPAWQADQLVSAQWLLVPSFGCTFYTRATTFELTYGIALRLQLASGALP